MSRIIFFIMVFVFLRTIDESLHDSHARNKNKLKFLSMHFKIKIQILNIKMIPSPLPIQMPI